MMTRAERLAVGSDVDGMNEYDHSIGLIGLWQEGFVCIVRASVVAMDGY